MCQDISSQCLRDDVQPILDHIALQYGTPTQIQRMATIHHEEIGPLQWRHCKENAARNYAAATHHLASFRVHTWCTNMTSKNTARELLWPELCREDILSAMHRHFFKYSSIVLDSIRKFPNINYGSWYLPVPVPPNKALFTGTIRKLDN